MKCDNASKIIIFYNEILTRKVDLFAILLHEWIGTRKKKISNQLFIEKFHCIYKFITFALFLRGM